MSYPDTRSVSHFGGASNNNNTVITYMHAKPYINSNPIEYICLSKNIEKLIDQNQKKVIEMYISKFSEIEFITMKELLGLFSLMNDPKYDY